MIKYQTLRISLHPVLYSVIDNFSYPPSRNIIAISFAAIIFFLSVALTSGAMLIERNEGMLERCLVCGITGLEILFSHVVTQFLIMCFQSFLVLVFSFSVFDLTLNGETTLVVLLTILTGLCGMCFGNFVFLIQICNRIQ